MPQSKIGWTDDAINFYTWNCHKVSEGCKNCYAEARARATHGRNSHNATFLGAPNWRETATEELRLTKNGHTVFINTHSDTYHEAVPLGWIRRIHNLIVQRPGLIFLLLTKRPQRAYELAEQLPWPENLWLGVSVELPKYLHRIDTLRAIPAAHRFISFEPLLAPFYSQHLDLRLIEWAIVGGESGEDRRRFEKAWLEPFVGVCRERGVPLYFKQGSAVYPGQDRLYDGRLYDEFPPEFHALRERYLVKASQQSLF